MTDDLISPSRYIELLRAGITPPRMTGVCGRIVRGKADEDFTRLSFLPGRRLAWVIGVEGLRAMISMSDTEKILTIGKSLPWLEEKLAAGYRFRLVVLPSTAGQPADWTGLLASIRQFYPEIAERVGRWWPILRAQGVSAGVGIELRVSKIKDDPLHALHMSLEKYQNADDTLENARLFLLHSLGVNDLYDGTGTTGYANIRSGEYLVPNRSLVEFPNRAEVDLSPGASTSTMPMHGRKRADVDPAPAGYSDADAADTGNASPSIVADVTVSPERAVRSST